MNIPFLNNVTVSGVVITGGGTSNNWNTAYTNLVTNSAAYLLSGTDVNLGQIPVLSATWNTAYTNLVANSASYLSGISTNYQYISTSQPILLNHKYAVDTSIASITATLPSSINFGDQVEFMDITGTWNINNFYVNANGRRIEQDSSGILQCNVQYGKFELIYTANGNQTGWRIIPYPKHDIPTYTLPPIIIL